MNDKAFHDPTNIPAGGEEWIAQLETQLEEAQALLLLVIEERDRGRTPFTRGQLIAAAEQHLMNLHCSNWGRSYSVSQPNERRDVAEEIVDRFIAPVITLVR